MENNKLAYEKNISYIAKNLDVQGDEIERAIDAVNEYANENSGAYPLTDIFSEFNVDTRHAYKISLAEHLKNQAPIKKVINTANAINCLSKSHNTKLSHEAGLRTLSWVILRLTRQTRVERIEEKLLTSTLLQLKTPSGSFQDKVPTRYQQSARQFAKVLNELHPASKSGTCFLKMIAVPRGVSCASHARKLSYLKWDNYFEEYLGTLLLATTKSQRSAFKKFVYYLEHVQAGQEPEVYLCNQPSYSFLQYLEDNKINGIKAVATIMYDFCSYIIREKLTVNEDGEDIALAKQLLSSSEYDRVMRNKVKQDKSKPKPAESTKEVMPTKLTIMCKEILMEDDCKWPKSLDSQYFDWLNEDTGNYERVWCPTLTNLILMLLELPLRKIQAKSLDSGEGDEYKYDVTSQVWVENTSPHANYWLNHEAIAQNRGILRRIETAKGDLLVLYINTNKTQDREHAFSETSGYEIPWNNIAVINIVKEQLDWLEVYHPVDKPQDFGSLPTTVFGKKPTKSALEMIPERFYLFRCKLNNPNAQDGPPQEHIIVEFWNELMKELDKRIKGLGEDFNIITKEVVSNNAYISLFTPHGLRVSGLTSFYKAGVPIEILSKLVAGHKSLFMTFYYLKLSSEEITETLTEASKKIENNQQAEFKKFLRSVAYDEASKYMHTHKHFPSGSWSLVTEGLWEVTSLGICPNAGTLCNEGGPLLKKSNKAKKAVFGPVEGGEGNCIRCRFLITGEAFLIPLMLYGNKLLADAKKLSLKEEKHRKKLQELYNQRSKIVKQRGFSTIPDDLKVEINAAERLLEKVTIELDSVLNNLHPTHTIIEKIKKGTLTGTELIEKKEGDEDELAYEHISKFKQLNCLVQASRLYPHVADDDLERERDQFIDKVLFQLGKTPISFAPLTDEEKQKASDAFGNYLVSKLDDNELTALESNKAVSLDMLVSNIKFNELAEHSSDVLTITTK
ncbi:VPA1269 family protein [Psychrobium sp. 1_MG-2023]|uniref:VPA1269 family protein n=1 Tax=Psychrobium sp. 1_MG-2023 TaxID=3062624 RepID=UPI002735C734|nr:VPA1269 family protein [Psychrobium sp. 1_MG-2023]MDP2562790.1 VPA1269 family protein [Psychrobium sp. 1_MG-2023]